jgi:hypothetical protein
MEVWVAAMSSVGVENRHVRQVFLYARSFKSDI